MLGFSWNKREDLIIVIFFEEFVDVTKRGILRFLVVVYDSFGIVSFIMFVGKRLYREVCESRFLWDEKVLDRMG